MEENVQHRTTGLQKPMTRIPQFSTSVSNVSGLHEMTNSQSNMRQPTSSMPASNSSLKRGVPTPGANDPFVDPIPVYSQRRDAAVQSDAKRVPLSRRAGEFPDKPISTSHLPSQNVKGVSLRDTARPGVPGSRHTSTSSYSSSNSNYTMSVGAGARPPSRTRIAHSRARSTTRVGRPATSMGTREEVQQQQQQGNNGIVPPTTPTPLSYKSSYSSLQHNKKPRKYQSLQDMGGAGAAYKEPLPASREVSISSQFQSLSLNDKNKHQQGAQAASNSFRMPPPATTFIPQPVFRQKGGGGVGQREVNVEYAERDLVAPKTPAKTPGKQLILSLEKSINNLKRTPIPAMTPSSPTKGPYLSKYSNTTGYVVSEIEEKIQSMDSEFQRLKEFMNTTEKNSVNVKEELEMAKKRVTTLEDQRSDLQAERAKLLDKVADAERELRILKFDMEDQQRRHDKYCEDLISDHERKMRAKVDDYEREMDKVVKLQQEFEDKCGAEAEARLENLSRENKELRSNLEFQKRDHERELHRLNMDIERQCLRMKDFEESLKKSEEEQKTLQAQIDENFKTIDRLRKRAEDAEESLSKDKGHLGGQISLLSQKLDFSSERIQSLEEHNKAVQSECEKKLQEIQLAAQKRIDEETKLLRDRLIKEEERRHKLFEQVQELKGNIRVMCRIKPPSDPANDALIKFNPRASDLDEDKIDGLLIPTEREDFREPGKMIPGKPKEFNFERVFDDRCTNKDVFDEISQLVQSVMDGKKVCIFCYGQTGSGKTFTMSRKGDGIIPRTQDMIFGEVDRLKALGWEYTVEGSYLEVYQDKLYDLLASRSAKPEPLTVDPIGEELNIKGHSFTLLKEERDLDEMVRTADNNRHTAATAMNDRSSRSHSILVLKIVGTKKNEEGEVVRTRKGTLNLIDLAGSESPDKARGEQIYREGVEINSSLSYLRTVLASLGQGKTEGVDFRSYTLTQLLRPSLGKGCRTLMFVMVSPLKENESETVRSLEFARDAQKVKMGGGGASKAKKSSSMASAMT